MNTSNKSKLMPAVTIATLSNAVALGAQAIKRTTSPEVSMSINGEMVDVSSLEEILTTRILNKLECK